MAIQLHDTTSQMDFNYVYICQAEEDEAKVEVEARPFTAAPGKEAKIKVLLQ